MAFHVQVPTEWGFWDTIMVTKSQARAEREANRHTCAQVVHVSERPSTMFTNGTIVKRTVVFSK